MPRESRDRAIVKAMLRYSPPPPVGKPQRALSPDDWEDWEIPREVGDLLARDLNAFLIGAIFDFHIKAKMAWRAPFELKRRLGHLNVRRIAKMRASELAKYIRRGPTGPALHQYAGALAQRVQSACRRLVKKYNGLASNIWQGRPPASEVIKRLDEFDGIGQKISSMVTRLLVACFGVRLTHWQQIDVAVDRHVACVFLRTGLVQRPQRSYAVSEVRPSVVAMARKLRPRFPAALDYPAFAIGQKWCAARKPDCDRDGESCPLRSCCRKRTGMRILGVGAGRSGVCTGRRRKT